MASRSRERSAKPVTLRLTSYRASSAKPAPTPASQIKQAQPARRTPAIAAVPMPLPPAEIAADRLSITLPIPPSINHQYATVNGRRVLSAAGREYKNHVGHLIMVALSRAPHREPLMHRVRSEYLALSLQFYFQSPLRRDLDGGLKITQDAIAEALGINDARIVELHLFKALSAVQPRVECSLSAATLK